MSEKSRPAFIVLSYKRDSDYLYSSPDAQTATKNTNYLEVSEIVRIFADE